MSNEKVFYEFTIRKFPLKKEEVRILGLGMTDRKQSLSFIKELRTKIIVP